MGDGSGVLGWGVGVVECCRRLGGKTLPIHASPVVFFSCMGGVGSDEGRGWGVGRKW